MEVGHPGGHGVYVQSAVTQVKGQGHGVALIKPPNMGETTAVELVLKWSPASLHLVQVTVSQFTRFVNCSGHPQPRHN